MEQGRRDERTIARERAVLVGVLLPESPEEREPLRELQALAETAGVEVVGSMLQSRRRPDGRTYIGKGKVAELAAAVMELRAGVVLFDNDLAPTQLKHLEEELRCKVLDRTELVLDIFANRATTHAAQLQVEIAQLEYTAPRLRAMWSHLGQVTGGAPVGVGTRGPGEKQIEIDRRLVSKRLTALKAELAQVLARRTREVEARRRTHDTVCLVGYTNAGKSTLFNALTAGGAYADDKLFATLQSRVEAWPLGGGDTALLSDTVGFIRNLPHRLVAGFRATLEDAVAAEVLLVVADAADPEVRAQLATVREVLGEIGATAARRIVVFNKVDALRDAADRSGSPSGVPAGEEAIAALVAEHPGSLAVSARTGEGLERLREVVRDALLGEARRVRLELPLSDARAVDFIEKRGRVESREYLDGVVRYEAQLARGHLERLVQAGARIRVDGMEGNEAIRRLFPEQSPPAPPRVPAHERTQAP